MVTLRPYRTDDWPAVRRIYAEGIETGIATFETEPKPQQTWEGKSVPGSQLVAEEDGDVIGWALLWPVSDRCAYRGVAEVSVYIAASARGRGVGKALLTALNGLSEELGIWTQQAGIFAENTASIGLHEACGYRLVGIRERLGCLDGRWRNIAFMERRSTVVGV
ncbi:GNAT family N-acetyltransferase [Kordiimonas marina]|uniref:GNAT family N-acetyltransferase n=1 Tax=Kordiimonas marina TaxID=2872312 RepID=UPI001FF1D430|nr:GNAT family N-acetyltransferase [Kordiimonas marina]MCJ9427665.1 GNAT family N-acetyltransferase [Kordiimonas marina]